jgi:hypothetical protein
MADKREYFKSTLCVFSILVNIALLCIVLQEKSDQNVHYVSPSVYHSELSDTDLIELIEIIHRTLDATPLSITSNDDIRFSVNMENVFLIRDISKPEVNCVLQALILHDNPRVRQLAMWSLFARCGEKSSLQLCVMLSDPNFAVRDDAIKILQYIYPTSPIDLVAVVILNQGVSVEVLKNNTKEMIKWILANSNHYEYTLEEVYNKQKNQLLLEVFHGMPSSNSAGDE